MKKLFVSFVLFSAFVLAQSEYVTIRYTSILEATAQTKYVDLGDWSRIDSVGLTLAGVGEVDIDSVDVYPGFKAPGGEAYYFTTAYTFLADPNVAAATKFWTNGVGATADKDAATVLTSAVMRGGINSLKVSIAGADGSEAGNVVYAIFRIWGVPKGGT
jgi:hypothetical protein